MGGSSSKQEFRRAILELVSSSQSVTTLDASFWERFWSDPYLSVSDYFSIITYEDVRTLRDKASGNLTALCFKIVERIAAAAATACTGQNEQQIVLNCVSLLTRLLPFLFEAPDWRLLFWSPANFLETSEGEQPQALAQVLLNALADLLFCPDFTVMATEKLGPEKPDVLSSLDSCEYIWEKGIGNKISPGTTKQMDNNRTAILRLLITCFSEALYLSPSELSGVNRWLSHFTSTENRHVLPLLTSLLNMVCTYDPVGYGVPYYYAMVDDPRGRLVETCVQFLSILLDYTPPGDLTRRQRNRHLASGGSHSRDSGAEVNRSSNIEAVDGPMANLFCSFVSRLQLSEDLEFIAKGLTGLLMNPLRQTYLPNSIKKIYFSQELYIIFWKLFELNHTFMMHMLRSTCLFDLVVPLLHQLLLTRTNPALVGMLHMGAFILLLLSGERNFGVRLNKPYTLKIPFYDIPKCSGSHADLLFLVFHKIITSGLPRLQPLYDCLLTVMVNVSPYLKSLSMVTSARLLHLMESFATPWFLFAKPTNHFLIFYLLEIFNNIIQYQFDGNTNLVYSIIRSKAVFHQLVNLSENQASKPPPLEPPVPEESEQSQQVVSGHTISNTGEDDSGMSLTTSGDRVADIQPIGRLQTVQVEVEPDAGILEEEVQQDMEEEVKEKQEVENEDEPVDGEAKVASGETEVAGEESEAACGESKIAEDEAKPTEGVAKPPEDKELSAKKGRPPESIKETELSLVSDTPTSPTPSTTPSASSISLSSPSQPLPASRRIPRGGASFLPNSAVAEGLDEAARRASRSSLKKKASKTKPLSGKDLFPLHQDVGRSNRQLAEPTTPNFKPTPEWVLSWKRKLPLETVLRVLKVLVPQVEKICTENDVKSEHEVLAYLKNGTLVGLLPVPHPIIIRKYQASQATELWFHTYIWGVVYVRNFDPPIWFDTTIKLFQVHKTDS